MNIRGQFQRRGRSTRRSQKLTGSSIDLDMLAFYSDDYYSERSTTVPSETESPPTSAFNSANSSPVALAGFGLSSQPIPSPPNVSSTDAKPRPSAHAVAARHVSADDLRPRPSFVRGTVDRLPEGDVQPGPSVVRVPSHDVTALDLRPRPSLAKFNVDGLAEEDLKPRQSVRNVVPSEVTDHDLKPRPSLYSRAPEHSVAVGAATVDAAGVENCDARSEASTAMLSVLSLKNLALENEAATLRQRVTALESKLEQAMGELSQFRGKVGRGQVVTRSSSAYGRVQQPEGTRIVSI